MIAIKKINNNFVLARENEREVVVMGRGLGFDITVGKEIDGNKIQKIFRLGNKLTSEQFARLLEEVPVEHVQISYEMIDYIKEHLGKKINANIYVTLTDHISFTIERFRSGIRCSNPLLYDVKILYPTEFQIGKRTLKLIKKRTGLDFPDDEAASIALHIVNSEYETDIGQLMHITEHIGSMIRFIEEYFDMKLQENSLDFERFVTHLRFFLMRLQRGESIAVDSTLTETIKLNYAREYGCAVEIVSGMCAKYQRNFWQNEVIYLAIHIRRLLERERDKKNHV